MPPSVNSRHILVNGVTRITDGLTFLLDREPLRFRNRKDNKRVLVNVGDSWHSLAHEHLQPIENAAQLWWVLADYQPVPVIDPTVQPVPGTYVYIPTPEFVMAEVFSRNRKAESEL